MGRNLQSEDILIIFAHMKDYIRTDITLTPWNQDFADFLAALLADIGYESFTSTEPVLSAFILKDIFDKNNLQSVISDFPAPDTTLSAANITIEGEDWNNEWEKHYFKPLVVADKCVVRSTFHTDAPQAEYEIIVDPKMAFGTGHHSTTRLMLEYILDHEMKGKTVIDMGTGTGILAILSCMRGAKTVYGVEIDPDAYDNACYNAELNAQSPQLICGDASALENLPETDLFLANINRNIIMADMESYLRKLKSGARFVCSGFYLSDLDLIKEKASVLGLKFISYASDKDWIRAEFSVS